MNIRQAILKAADSIERFPSLFNFVSTDTPNAECGMPGCALGWIGFHLSLGTAWFLTKEIYQLMGLPLDDDEGDDEFYARMRAIHGSCEWKYDSDLCADTLRQYADKYHPETDHIPASVRAIFTEQVAA